MTHRDFIRMVNGSIRYEIHGAVLEITGYYSGGSVKLDLNAITEEMFEELIVEEEDEDYE